MAYMSFQFSAMCNTAPMAATRSTIICRCGQYPRNASTLFWDETALLARHALAHDVVSQTFAFPGCLAGRAACASRQFADVEAPFSASPGRPERNRAARSASLGDSITASTQIRFRWTQLPGLVAKW